jgi:two-component system response regulator AtoC
LAQKKQILIIDDEENMRHMLSVLLTDAGYSCSAAANGEKALKAFESDVYDFVLCDIRMPKMDGASLLQ